MSAEERHEIAAMRILCLGVLEIARRLRRRPSTLHRELKRNASVQKASTRESRSRRKPRFGAAAFVPVEALIRIILSPEQIVGRMKLEGTKVMSHETIYRWIWKDKAEGGVLLIYLRGAGKQRCKR